MNENDIREFQETFAPNRRLVDETHVPENPFLKSELTYAISTGMLTARSVVIYSDDDSGALFADVLSHKVSNSFPDFYIFRVDLKEMVDLMKFTTLQKYKKFLLYANLLIIENLEFTEKNSTVLQSVTDIINNLHSTSNLLVTTKKPIEEMNLDIQIKNILLAGKMFKIESIPKKAVQADAFQNFTDFISDMKREAGVQEDVNEGEKREEYIEKLYIWEMKNFNVERLKKIISEDDISLMKQEFDSYTNKVKKLVELHKDYGLLNPSGFEKEASEIESMLFDPDMIDAISLKIEELKEKIKFVRIFTTNVKLSMTYETFITDATNRLAYNKIAEIVNGENADRIAVITGTNGTGKTHLLNSICNRFYNKRIILIDKNNIENAVNNAYVMKFMEMLDIVLIDDFDTLYENKNYKPVLKNIVMNNVQKVLTMYRKFSIDDREVLNYINKFQSYNIQPTSLFIKKNVFKIIMLRLGLTVNDFLLNYMLDQIDIPLSAVESKFAELKRMSGDELPSIENISFLFPQSDNKKTIAKKKSEYDTSRLVKEWVNEHDRLYVEFEV